MVFVSASHIFTIMLKSVHNGSASTGPDSNSNPLFILSQPVLIFILLYLTTAIIYAENSTQSTSFVLLFRTIKLQASYFSQVDYYNFYINGDHYFPEILPDLYFELRFIYFFAYKFNKSYSFSFLTR